jgi:hypothetical protein
MLGSLEASDDARAGRWIWCLRGVAVAVVAAGNVALSVGTAAGTKAELFGHLMVGPLAGWLVAVEMGALPGALELLIPSTLLSIIPLAVHVLRGSLSALLLGSSFWWLSGYYFCLGMWI